MAKPRKATRPMVVSRHGRYRFQTGMITASLLQRGLPMADAFAISNLLKADIADLSEITPDQLEERLQGLLRQTERHEDLEQGPLTGDIHLSGAPTIIGVHGEAPFSRSLLMRYLITSGLEIEAAMELGRDIDQWVSDLGEDELTEDLVEAEVIRRLTARYGKSHARRYRLTCWIRAADKPVIVLIGGSTGTGKSTLATELAFRLGIRLVTSTDMIRETLRTVLSPAVVPGLHDHSFRGFVQDGVALSDPRERVLAGFHQQCNQVAVGVRGVVRRAVRENAHMIVEGTHIRPPFSQYIPPEVDVYSAGFVLAVPEEPRHKARFPQRAREQIARDPATYLEAFQSVRWIHDDLLLAAEDAQGVIVANDELNQTIGGVVGYLSRALPVAEPGPGTMPGALHPPGKDPGIRTLFLIVDGLADEANPALDGQTPLQAAETPYLNILAGSGGQGRILTTKVPGVAPGTDQGLMALLGEPQTDGQLGRGLLEALGQGLPLQPGTILWRGNMATVEDDGTLVDRRAGRIRAGVSDLLAELRNIQLPDGIHGHIYPGHEHRVVVMLQGQELSASVSDSDPGGEAAVQQILAATPLDDSPEAARTARALGQLLDIASKHLHRHPHNTERVARGLFPANCIITRGASFVGTLPRQRFASSNTALISACPTALGVARAVGLQPATSPEMTGNLDSDIDAKFNTAAKLLEERPYVVIHIKGADIAAHDRRPIEKRNFISLIDRALGAFLEGYPEITDGLRIVVSADHGTSSISGNHLADPVPLLLSTWHGDGEAAEFSEESAMQGAMGLLQAGELSEVLWGN
jgi:2,3-bisphosphoglycerate-independent phosphoglycerate mutase